MICKCHGGKESMNEGKTHRKVEGTQLAEGFFDENPIMELSAAQLTYFNIVMLNVPDFNNQIAEMVVPIMKRERREQYEAEKKAIFGISSADEVIKYMRKIKELQNREALLNKALDMQDEVIPLVLKRLVTSGHDVFIESAAILLSHADSKYVEQLYDMFRDIRNPYARSAACLVFGVKKKIEYTPLLLEQYELIKKEVPEKDYEQGPLFALYLLHGVQNQGV